MKKSWLAPKCKNWITGETIPRREWLTLDVPHNEGVTLNEQAPAELCISGQIGKDWWDDSGTSGKEFRNAINEVPRGQKINLRINSEGGSVQDGLEIHNAIKERSADVTAHISGYAVSIASVIPLAAARVISPTSSIWMIHEPWSVTQGNAKEHEKSIEMLNKHSDMLCDIYQEHTGQSRSAIKEAMDNETWFTGEEACDWGLADECDESDCNNMSRLNVSAKAFRNVPSVIFNMLGQKPISAAQQGAATQTQNQNAEILMKKLLIALLNRHGIKNAAGKEWAETDTDAEINAAVEKLAPPQIQQPAMANIVDIQAQLDAIKRNRIQDMVDGYIADNKITKDEAPIYIEAALKDESKVKAILDAKPSMQIGGAAAGTYIQVSEPQHPILFGRTSEMMQNVVKEAGNDKVKAYKLLSKNMAALRQDAMRRDAVKNENTISSSLTTNFLILGATTQASPKFASVKMFSRDTSVDPYKPLATGQMKYNTTVQDGSTTQTNATNFESGDSTVTNVAVTVSQYTEAFHLTNGQLNDGIRMEDLVVAKMASLGSKISKVLAANITAANYSTLTPVIRSTSSFGFGDMQTLWGALKKANRKHVMLDGPYLANLINILTLFQPTPVVPGAGWENLLGWDYVALHTEWSAAGNNILGFGCDPQALGVIAGLPLVDSPAIPGGILAQAQGMCMGVDLPIAVYAWFNTSTRTYWASYDIMFGASALDTTIGCVIATGTPS